MRLGAAPWGGGVGWGGGWGGGWGVVTRCVHVVHRQSVRAHTVPTLV